MRHLRAMPHDLVDIRPSILEACERCFSLAATAAHVLQAGLQVLGGTVPHSQIWLLSISVRKVFILFVPVLKRTDVYKYCTAHGNTWKQYRYTPLTTEPARVNQSLANVSTTNCVHPAGI